MKPTGTALIIVMMIGLGGCSEEGSGGEGEAGAPGSAGYGAAGTGANAGAGMPADGNTDAGPGAGTGGNAGTDSGGGGEAGTDSSTDGDAGGDTAPDGGAGTGGSEGVECEPDTDYDAQGVTCYVDSQNGDDTRSGLSEAEAVRSQSAIGATCTVVRYRRGSVFNEALQLTRNVLVYTNYGDAGDPLPRFVVPRVAMSGPVVQAMMFSGITIDGLYLSGSCGDGTMQNLMGGICVMLGADSKLLNNEITDCDIGIMLSGEGSLVRGNYVHDLIMGVDAPPGIDPNLVGGAEGIFINASNSEVSYNSFIRCKGPAEWVGANGGCDGGATEVTVRAGEIMTGVKVHHNFSYDNCGFFEAATTFGDAKGTFADSEFYNNVTVDSGWMGLLQVNNTDLRNIRFYNNTLVQRANSTSAGLLWIIFTDTSSGMTGGELLPDTVFLTNNLFVFDGVTTFGDLIDPAFAQTTNLVISTSQQDPGFVDISGDTAPDFDLTSSSPAINTGTLLPDNTLDYLTRPIPDPDGSADIGAFEFGSTQGACLPPRLP
jgi:hypothetical protein